VLDSAIIESLLAAHDNLDLFRAAVGQAQLQARDGRSGLYDVLCAVTNELAKVDASVDRYLRAFESGSMPEALCGERVKELATRATNLRASHEKLNEEMEHADITCASPEELATLRDQANEAITEGSPAVVKSFLQALIHEIRGIAATPSSPSFACLWLVAPWRAMRFAHRPDRWALGDSNPRPQPCESVKTLFSRRRDTTTYHFDED
jgi:hypothetical protein